uniref:Uncharacterized protein n=1 Tax=Oryza glumipatula TaxID=40148 RepID=A0A0E0AGG6_9ORYZ
MAAATMALSSSFAAVAAAAGGAPWRAAVRFPPRRRVALVVRAQAEPEVEPTKEETATSSSPIPSPAAAAAPKAKPAGLWDVLAFSGPAPERINGRLAMVGFVSALAN